MKCVRKILPLSAVLIGIPILVGAQVELGSPLPGESNSDFFGISVDISEDGGRVIVGGEMNDGNGIDAGHVRVFEYNGSFWVQLGNDINGESTGDLFGGSVSISADGETVAVGARFNDDGANNVGHVCVFRFNGVNWYQIGSDINGENGGDLSGSSVGLSSDGNRVVIGAPKNINVGPSAGHARVFEFNGTNWIQVGQDLDAEGQGDRYGDAVSISHSGNIVAVGGHRNDGNGSNSGHVRVFEYDTLSALWVQMGPDIDGESPLDHSGFSVSISANGNVVAIGADRNDDNGTNSGHVRVFSFDSANVAWVQMGLDIEGSNEQDRFGVSVDISADGTKLVAGSARNDAVAQDCGEARVFRYDGINWQQEGSSIHGALNDMTGTSVAISGDGESIAVGSPTKNGDSEGTAIMYDITKFLSLSEQSLINVNIYPNPTQGVVTIDGIIYESVFLYDQSGRQVGAFAYGDQINLSHLEPGLYIMTLTNDGTSISKRVQKF